MKERSALIGFKTRPSLKEAAAEEAERQNRTLSNLCENALEFYLEHEAVRVDAIKSLGGLRGHKEAV